MLRFFICIAESICYPNIYYEAFIRHISKRRVCIGIFNRGKLNRGGLWWGSGVFLLLCIEKTWWVVVRFWGFLIVVYKKNIILYKNI